MGIADPAPIDPDPPLPPDVPLFADHRALLREARPDVVVICTPPQTHLAIARDAFAAGCAVLLEKPPVLTLADHRALVAAGGVCQVGFQALGSLALQRLVSSMGAGALGTVTGIATVAAWQRDDAYYARSPWAGRRATDGVLVNPLAHALMQCLAVADAVDAGPPVRIAAERYRTRAIEADDTAFVRLTLRSGLPVLAAVTLAGEDFIRGDIVVTGTSGRAVLEYPTDRLTLPGAGTCAFERIDLLDNLLAHRADPGVALVAPLERTAGFTAVVAALIGAGPAASTLDGDLVADIGAGPARVRSIRGINAILRRAAGELALPSELGVPWASPPWTQDVGYGTM